MPRGGTGKLELGRLDMVVVLSAQNVGPDVKKIGVEIEDADSSCEAVSHMKMKTLTNTRIALGQCQPTAEPRYCPQVLVTRGEDVVLD